MKKNTAHTFSFYQFEHLSVCKDILHFVSSGEKNIGFPDEGEMNLITENRRLLAESVGFDIQKMVTGHQVHSSNIAVVGQEGAGRGALDKSSRLPDTDALVTNVPGICLMALSADCVPILLYDPCRQVIAAVHAGWRGTVADIAGETIESMKKNFGCLPENILVGIGPSIGVCCFEVNRDVADFFTDKFEGNSEIVRNGKTAGKYHVDLWEANRHILLSKGITPEHVEMAGICTVCSSENLFSYRRDGKAAGRFGAGIALRAAD